MRKQYERFSDEEILDFEDVATRHFMDEIPEQMHRRGHSKRAPNTYDYRAIKSGIEIKRRPGGKDGRANKPSEAEVEDLRREAITATAKQLPDIMEALGHPRRTSNGYHGIAGTRGIQINRGRHYTTNQELKEIERLRWEGKTMREIIDITGIKMGALTGAIKKHGFEITPSKRKRRGLKPQRRAA